MELPVTIRKHWFGYFVIVLGVFAVLAVIWAGIISLWRSNQLDEPTYWMLGIVSILVLVIGALQLYVYSLSYIELTADRLKAENWSTLFAQTDVDAEWIRVQDVTVETGSLFALMFGYGTLIMQTAGTSQNLRMTMVPNVERWRDIIIQLVDQSTGDDQVDLSTIDVNAEQ